MAVWIRDAIINVNNREAQLITDIKIRLPISVNYMLKKKFNRKEVIEKLRNVVRSLRPNWFTPTIRTRAWPPASDYNAASKFV